MCESYSFQLRPSVDMLVLPYSVRVERFKCFNVNFRLLKTIYVNLLVCYLNKLLESFYCIIEAQSFCSDDVLTAQWIMSVTRHTKTSIKTP